VGGVGCSGMRANEVGRGGAARVWWRGVAWGGVGGVGWRGWRGVTRVARVGCSVVGWGTWNGVVSGGWDP